MEEEYSDIARLTNKQAELYTEIRECFDSIITYAPILEAIWKHQLDGLLTNMAQLHTFISKEYRRHQEHSNYLVNELLKEHSEHPSSNNITLFEEILSHAEGWERQLNREQEDLAFNKQAYSLRSRTDSEQLPTKTEEADHLQYLVVSFILANIKTLLLYIRNVLDELKRSNIPDGDNIKLKWNGTNEQLYHVLRQLKQARTAKGQGMLENSFDDIAKFLIKNFEGFEKASLTSLTKNISKKGEPKKDPIDIGLDAEQL